MKTNEELEQELITLKNKFKKVYSLEVKLDDDGEQTATIFLKKPDKTISTMINGVISKLDSYKVCEAFLKATYIGGDELALILNDEDALISCEDKIVKMLERREAILKKN